jgi:hypothetical protein
LDFLQEKKEQIGAPQWIGNDSVLMTNFIKGIADTDFSLMLVNKPSKLSTYYPIVSLKLKSKVLIKEIGQFLMEEGYMVNVIEEELRIDNRGYNNTKVSTLNLSGRKNLGKWMKNIGFRNPRHIEKHIKYLNSIK